MPMKPKHPCNYPGCNELVDDKYCDNHKVLIQKEYDRRRGTATERGYDARWRAARVGFLRLHPMCNECMKNGYTTPATVVDHIIPHKGNKQLFWDRSNWQALCKKCHDTKTAREDGGFGNANKS